MKKEEGNYTIKRVKKLPKRGNSNLLYLLIGEIPIVSFYRWNYGVWETLPIGSAEQIVEGGGGGLLVSVTEVTASELLLIHANDKVLVSPVPGISEYISIFSANCFLRYYGNNFNYNVDLDIVYETSRETVATLDMTTMNSSADIDFRADIVTTTARQLYVGENLVLTRASGGILSGDSTLTIVLYYTTVDNVVITI